MQIYKQKAIQLLFHPESYPGMSTRNATDIKLLLWRNNSLGDYTSWTLIQAGDRCIVRRVVWNQRSTYHLNEPETYCADALIENMQMHDILISLHTCLDKNAINESNQLMIDGVLRGFIYQNIKREWSQITAVNNTEIDIWHKDTTDYLESLFNW